jgi:hypothetical protein
MTSSHAPDEPVLEQRLERFRTVRRELESAVLPLATSIDGLRFSFQTSLHGLDLRLGGYVVLEYDGTERLGQIRTLELDQREGTELDMPGDRSSSARLSTHVMIRFARGEGTILDGDGTPLHDAAVRPATDDEVQAWLSRIAPRRAALEIGRLALAPGVACSTQRPQKVHENVISQCDNLVLMRLNSEADAAFARAVFSFVPPGLVGEAATFGLGEALVAGKIHSHPALIRFGARVAEEAGSDVPATWARQRTNAEGAS